MQNKRSGAQGSVAIKLDMSKAYDWVEWHFLEDMMRKMGLHEEWIKMIMKCVTSVNYRIKVNNTYSDTIIPQRGLRQGDPLSPYLFLICGEAFSPLLNKAEADGKLQGVKVCATAPSFNHLLFVDDSLVIL
jgi:hypothetical protein